MRDIRCLLSCVILLVPLLGVSAFPGPRTNYTTQLDPDGTRQVFINLITYSAEHFIYAPDPTGYDGLDIGEFSQTFTGDCEDFAFYDMIVLQSVYGIECRMLIVDILWGGMHALVWVPAVRLVGDPTSGAIWDEDTLPKEYRPWETLTLWEAGVKFLY